MTQVLTVAVGHRDNLCADWHQFSARLLVPPAEFVHHRKKGGIAPEAAQLPRRRRPQEADDVVGVLDDAGSQRVEASSLRVCSDLLPLAAQSFLALPMLLLVVRTTFFLAQAKPLAMLALLGVILLEIIVGVLRGVEPIAPRRQADTPPVLIVPHPARNPLDLPRIEAKYAASVALRVQLYALQATHSGD